MEQSLQNYLDSNHKHKYYKECKEHAEAMSIHVNGEKPKKLLEITRPNEPDHVKRYRLEIFQPITKSLSDKVVNTVNRIFNPRLYNVNWKDEPSTLGEETLKQYLTKDFPYYRSIWNFIRETYTPKDFEDPNAVLVVEPESYDIQDTEYFKPCAKIISSEYVTDFEDDSFFVIKYKDKVKIYDTQKITYLEKNKSNWKVYFEYEHNFGFVPAFRLGGLIKGKFPYYYESFISGVLPHWNRVVTLSSDLDAQYIGHMYLERWTFEVDCTAEGCDAGWIYDGDDKHTCQTCGGTGKVGRTPYGEIKINHDALNPDAPIPTPPAGYIDKPIEIVTKSEEKISSEEMKGFAAINMEILNKVGENQSGIAKTIDRQDFDSFLLKYSNHVFEYVLPKLIQSIAAWRYSVVLNGNLDLVIPEISTPKEFTVLSLDFLTEEYKSATQAKVGAHYIRNLEEELVNTRFKNDEIARKKNLAIIRLNPFPNKTSDELLTIANLLPRSQQYKIQMSLLIDELVTMAIEQNDGFLDLTLSEQREIIKSLIPDNEQIMPSPLV